MLFTAKSARPVPYADAQLPAPRERMPRHIAIIMDGNGRWAQNRFRPRVWGHQRGARTVRLITEEAARLGLQQLTLYAFSAENWRRPADEVGILMRLYKRYLVDERRRIMDNDIRFKVIGGRDRLPAWVLEEMDKTIALSAGNAGMTLCLAVDYGGRDEIVGAARRLMAEAAAGRMRPEDLDERTFSEHLLTTGCPDPDLLIRTAGEMRLSNFLLWQISYSELWVTDVCWPDFGVEHLHAAVAAYARRERRFGGLGAK
jgi:undecaprenyl diphosphate synthase